MAKITITFEYTGAEGADVDVNRLLDRGTLQEDLTEFIHDTVDEGDDFEITSATGSVDP